MAKTAGTMIATTANRRVVTLTRRFTSRLRLSGKAPVSFPQGSEIRLTRP